MQKPQYLISTCHIANPRISGRANEPIAESCEDTRHHQNRIRRMKTVDCIGNQVACRSHQCDSSLAEGAVDVVVQQGGAIVTNQQGQKHQRYDDVSKAIEGF